MIENLRIWHILTHYTDWRFLGCQTHAVNRTSCNACSHLSSALPAPSHNSAHMNMSLAFAVRVSPRYLHGQNAADIIALLSAFLCHSCGRYTWCLAMHASYPTPRLQISAKVIEPCFRWFITFSFFFLRLLRLHLFIFTFQFFIFSKRNIIQFWNFCFKCHFT